MDKNNWFIYEVKAHPNHTDYAGVVWHGSYLAWMEEARVEYLRSHGVEYADLVALGFELPVVELSLRYHRAIRMGMTANIKTRIAEIKGVKIHWDYKIESPDLADLYVSGRVTLVGVDREKGRIVRKLPPLLRDALGKMSIT
jgi:acyl-CoA thioester hydrolase